MTRRAPDDPPSDHLRPDMPSAIARSVSEGELGTRERLRQSGPVDARGEFIVKRALLIVAPSPPQDVGEDFTSGFQAMNLNPNSSSYTYHTPPEQYQSFVPPAFPYGQMAYHRPTGSTPPQAYKHPGQTFSIEHMHGMPGYPGRPPVSRSNESSPFDLASPYPGQATPHVMTRPPGPYAEAIWTSPPMSPVMQSSYGSMSQGSRPTLINEFGQPSGIFYGGGSQPPPSAWSTPSSPFAYYTPFQAQNPQMEPHMVGSDWSTSTSPMLSQDAFVHRGSLAGSFNARQGHNPNRLSWSGPPRGFAPLESGKDRERKPYHPQPPVRRSDWVMWVGNVPPNTSHEELWRYFNNTVPSNGSDPDAEPWRGPSSIFLISRSSCAFVNLSSQSDLDRAVSFFNGRSLRPWDPRCPRMVCRVRRKDDDLRAGVGAQRGTGMHREWVKDQERQGGPPTVQIPSPAIEVSDSSLSATSTASASSVPPSPAILEHPPEGEGRRRESVGATHKSSASFASTNSSFLTKHFPRRVFILKSMTNVCLNTTASLISGRA